MPPGWSVPIRPRGRHRSACVLLDQRLDLGDPHRAARRRVHRARATARSAHRPRSTSATTRRPAASSRTSPTRLSGRRREAPAISAVVSQPYVAHEVHHVRLTAPLAPVLRLRRTVDGPAGSSAVGRGERLGSHAAHSLVDNVGVRWRAAYERDRPFSLLRARRVNGAVHQVSVRRHGEGWRGRLAGGHPSSRGATGTYFEDLGRVLPRDGATAPAQHCKQHTPLEAASSHEPTISWDT